MTKSPRAVRSLIALIGAACTSLANAQAYPSKPVLLIVPFAAGGPTDVLARIIADGVSKTLGQKVVVENRAGAGGAIGLEATAKAAPDGYTIAFGGTSTNILSPALQEKRPYDTVKDFVGVAIPNDLPLVFVSTTEIPPRNLKALVNHMRASPNPTPFVSSGPGTSSHIFGAAFAQAVGAKSVAVNYKSSGVGVPDLIAGRVSFTAGEGTAVVLDPIRQGRLVGMAVLAGKRLPTLPDVPTMQEAYPDAPDFMKRASFNVIIAPAKTPRDVVEKLNHEIYRGVHLPDTKNRIEQAGLFVRDPMTPAQVAQYLSRELASWSGVVKQTGILDAVKAAN
jgi:tripartite-type tricarboxylate transporter receptor subunit TctC